MEKALFERLSENAWLTFVPIVATYLAFLFQGSYFSYFGVPWSLVEIDIPKIIFAMMVLVVVVVLFSVLFSFVADLLYARNVLIQICGRGLMAVVVFLPFILVAADEYSFKQLALGGSFFFCVWLLNFLPPAQKAGETRTYLERLRVREDEYLSSLRAKPMNIKQMVGKRVLEPFFLLSFLSLYVVMLGAYCASAFGGSFHLKGDPRALYVGKSNGSYIFTLIDQRTNTFGGEVRIIHGGDLEVVHATRTAKRRINSQVEDIRR